MCRATIELFRSKSNESGARAAFAAFRNRLRHGLGMEPAAETAELFDHDDEATLAQPRTTERRRPMADEDRARVSFVPRVGAAAAAAGFQAGEHSQAPGAGAARRCDHRTRHASSPCSVIAPHTAWQLRPVHRFGRGAGTRSITRWKAASPRILPATGCRFAIRLCALPALRSSGPITCLLGALSAPERCWDFTGEVARPRQIHRSRAAA